jgi:hypothetical protein
MKPTERAHNDAGIKCKLSNERFGLIEGMRQVIKYLNVSDSGRDFIIQLARDRDLVRLEDFLKTVNTIDSGKPRHCRIVNPLNAWNPSDDPDNDEHALNRFK